MASLSKSLYAIVAGVGPGTGGAVAKRFAKAYPVILLARQEASYKATVDEITQAGGRAIGVPTDVSDAAAVKHALETATASKELQLDANAKLVAAVYNASVFVMKPFLELEKEDLDKSLQVNAYGFFNFAQATLPHLLKAVESDTPHPPTLIVTGATAAIRGSAKFAGFAAGKFAKRAITQSLAREFGPQGIHVAHVIIDGGIKSPRYDNGIKDGMLSPDAIADSYWYLHTQPRSCFTQELDVRPYVEKF
ncbi:hypothetical protein BD289DRAFT_16755 [Coniella lustricola]|uniref:Short chain dehydrogenase n=1 Tax=Coniella lustricola TaxID=2025994 RepID=A0A2T3A3Q3_9PEZI|nr:hypothetical protein BD289DRAFT_16755 [Coniella lustricola]